VDGWSASQSSAVAETYPAVPDSVPVARQAVVRFATAAGATDDEVEAIRLATSEALTNALIHAYPGTPGAIYVDATLDSEGLFVRVADDGHGLHPRLDRRGVGIGLALIAEAATQLAIHKRPDGGTELQMRFAVSPGS
jgi:anti-sigma regulatory factor (Ser/Thr protein kinase)